MSNDPSSTPDPLLPNGNDPVPGSGIPHIIQTTEGPTAGVRSTATIKTACKTITGGYSALSLFAFCLFFLPWVRLSCNDVERISQSGYQVMTGKVSENENFEEEFEKKLTGSMGETGGLGGSPGGGFGGIPGGGLGGNPGGGLDVGPPGGFGGMGGGNLSFGPSEGGNDKKMDEFKKDIDPFYPLVLLPTGLLLTGLLGLIHLVGKPTRRPIVPLIGAIMAALTMLVCLVVEFPIEKELGAKIPAEMRGFLQFDRTAMPTVTLMIVILTLLAVIAHFVLASVASAKSSAKPGI